MLYFNLCFLLLILGFFAYSLKKQEEWMKDMDRKEHKLYLFYPLSYFILSKTGLDKILAKKIKVREAIKALYLTAKPELQARLFWCKQISLIIVILILINLMSVFGILSSKQASQIIDGKYLRRPDYGEGSTQVSLSVSLEGEDKEEISDTEEVPKAYSLAVSVDEQKYSRKELDIIFERSFEYLKKAVLGTNKSANSIYEKLNFVKVIPGTSIIVDWIPADYNLIKPDGSIANEGISTEGVQSSVTVILTYGEKENKQSEKQSMDFIIMPRQYEEGVILKQQLDEELDTASEKTREDKYFELPVSLEQYRLIWNDTRKNSSLTLLFWGIVLAAAVWMLGDKELEKQMKARKEQMLIDYPEVINKFTLLINAGMTIKQAWLKMAEDYDGMKQKNCTKQKNGSRIRFAYEEMLLTAHELKLGLPEDVSYEQYGKRAGLTSYIKFSSLISQNLKKGTKGFTELLMHEAAEAFEERKEAARRLGEEAGTKLLIPMLIMLIIVFLIIMIPAFLSFRI